MDSLSLTRALRRLQRTVVMLRTELRHEHVDEGLIADIEAQLEAGIATHPRTQHLRHLVDDHTDAPDVGRVATEAGVALLVLYHLIPANPGIDDQRWIDLVRPTYDGEIVVAHDLQVL